MLRRRHLLPAALAVAFVMALGWLGVSFVVLRIALTPTRSHCSAPTDEGVPAERLEFASAEDGTKLRGWLLAPASTQPGAPPSAGRGVVLIHGLDSCGWAGQHRAAAKEYARKGFTVVVFDLRAQGDSAGHQLGLGWKERGDVRAAVGVLLGRGIAPGKIGLHGSSYGAATALLSAAAIPEVGAVVADSSFADVRELMNAELRRKVGAAAALAPCVQFLARALYGLELAEIPPLLAVPKIAPRPIFFLHGSQDARIPVEHGRRLHAAAQPGDELWILSGAGHTEGFRRMPTEYLARTTGFLAAHLPLGGSAQEAR